MEYRLLSDVCEIIMGQSPDSTSYNENHDGLPFFQGNADFGEEYPEERVWCNDPKKTAEPGDILISVRAPIGAVNYAKIECCIGRGLAAIRPQKCNKAFIFYFLKSKNEALNLLGTGSTFKAIGKDVLSQLRIPAIDLKAQDEVALILKKAEDIIRKRKEQIQALDDLVKARFVEMFGDPVYNTKGWKMISLGELSDVGSSKRIFEKEYVSSGIPFYRTKEIVELSKGNPISTELYITEKRYEEIEKQYGAPQAGDLLISAVGTIGVIWIVDGKGKFYYKDGNLIRVSKSERFNSKYMKYLLEYLIAEYKKQMSAGTAYAALTISGLSKMHVYDVPLRAQERFAAFVDQVDKSKVVVQKALDETQMLFDSLMQEYFG